MQQIRFKNKLSIKLNYIVSMPSLGKGNMPDACVSLEK